MVEQAQSPGLDIVALVGDLGFPIVVSLYVLVRLDRRLEGLEQPITRLCLLLEKTSERTESEHPTFNV